MRKPMGDKDVMMVLSELLREALDRGLIETRPKMTQKGRDIATRLLERYTKEVEKNDKQ
jgi:hypothetical protein